MRWDRAHELSFRAMPLLFYCARLASDERLDAEVRAAFGTLGEDVLALVEITLGAIAPEASGQDTPAGRELARARKRIQAAAPKRDDTNMALDDLEKQRLAEMTSKAEMLAQKASAVLDAKG